MKNLIVAAALSIACLGCRKTPVYSPDCQRVSEQAMAACVDRSFATKAILEDCYMVGETAKSICEAKSYEQTNVADCLNPLWPLASSRSAVVASCNVAWTVYCSGPGAQAIRPSVPCDLIKGTLESAKASHARGPGWPGENRFFSVPETLSH